MTDKEVRQYLLSLEGAWIDHPFGNEVSVYKIGPKDVGKMFALVQEGSSPLRVSLRCDPKLSKVLRGKYESVMPGYNLDQKRWNTVLLTGQLGDDEVKDLMRHSYLISIELASGD